MTGKAEEPRRRLSAEARRDEIVVAALDLAAEQGVEKTTTQHMASAIGVTQGAIFRHFPTKDAIWLAVMEWVRGRVTQVIEDAASEGVDALDKLEKVFHAHVAFIARHPGIPRVLFSELRHSGDSRLKQLLQQVMAGYENRIVQILDEGRQSGLIDPGLDVRAAATLFLGMFQGLVLQASAFGDKRRLAAQAKDVFPVFLQGIRKRAAPTNDHSTEERK